MSVIGAVRDWIAQECPYLSEFRELFVDYLRDAECYGIEVTPVQPILKRYLGGATIRQKAFSFCSVEVLSGIDNIDTSEFFEEFQSWLESCSREGNLPDLGEGKAAQKIEATTDGYAYDSTGLRVQYRIQCRLVYYQED